MGPASRVSDAIVCRAERKPVVVVGRCDIGSEGENGPFQPPASRIEALGNEPAVLHEQQVTRRRVNRRGTTGIQEPGFFGRIQRTKISARLLRAETHNPIHKVPPVGEERRPDCARSPSASVVS